MAHQEEVMNNVQPRYVWPRWAETYLCPEHLHDWSGLSPPNYILYTKGSIVPETTLNRLHCLIARLGEELLEVFIDLIGVLLVRGVLGLIGVLLVHFVPFPFGLIVFLILFLSAPVTS